MTNNLIMIIGVTASGKGKLAALLAQKLGAEIISVDSMKVYKRMDIGTAKPPLQIREKLNYHLIDVVEPSDPFNVGKFLELADNATTQILARNKPVVAVGGTALYIKAMLHGLFNGPGTDDNIRSQLNLAADTQGLDTLYAHLQKADPQAADRIHRNDRKRIIRALEVYKLTGKPISSFQQQFDTPPSQNWTVIGLRREKELENHRINLRVKKMITDGLQQEVRNLLAEPLPLSPQAACAIGYAEMIRCENGDITLENAIELIKKNSRKLAKAQRTWFKTFRNVHWIDVAETDTADEVLAKAEKILTNISFPPSL